MLELEGNLDRNFMAEEQEPRQPQPQPETVVITESEAAEIVSAWKTDPQENTETQAGSEDPSSNESDADVTPPDIKDHFENHKISIMYAPDNLAEVDAIIGQADEELSAAQKQILGENVSLYEYHITKLDDAIAFAKDKKTLRSAIENGDATLVGKMIAFSVDLEFARREYQERVSRMVELSRSGDSLNEQIEEARKKLEELKVGGESNEAVELVEKMLALLEAKAEDVKKSPPKKKKKKLWEKKEKPVETPTLRVEKLADMSGRKALLAKIKRGFAGQGSFIMKGFVSEEDYEKTDGLSRVFSESFGVIKSLPDLENTLQDLAKGMKEGNGLKALKSPDHRKAMLAFAKFLVETEIIENYDQATMGESRFMANKSQLPYPSEITAIVTKLKDRYQGDRAAKKVFNTFLKKESAFLKAIFGEKKTAASDPEEAQSTARAAELTPASATETTPTPIHVEPVAPAEAQPETPEAAPAPEENAAAASTDNFLDDMLEL